MKNYISLDFTQNKESFESFYKDATVTETEKHKILLKSRENILKHVKKLNTLMNNYNIGVDQRVVYVSVMLLAMQDIVSSDCEILNIGLVPNDLKGIQTEQSVIVLLWLIT